MTTKISVCLQIVDKILYVTMKWWLLIVFLCQYYDMWIKCHRMTCVKIEKNSYKPRQEIDLNNFILHWLWFDHFKIKKTFPNEWKALLSLHMTSSHTIIACIVFKIKQFIAHELNTCLFHQRTSLRSNMDCSGTHPRSTHRGSRGSRTDNDTGTRLSDRCNCCHFDTVESCIHRCRTDTDCLKERSKIK